MTRMDDGGLNVPVRVVRMVVVALTVGHLDGSLSRGRAAVRNKVLISVDLPNPLLPSNPQRNIKRLIHQPGVSINRIIRCTVKSSFVWLDSFQADNRHLK